MSDFYEVVDWITKASVVPGVFFNLLLIVLVRKYSNANIGTFRYLLIVFAIYDILLINLHSILDPKTMTFPGVFACTLDFPFGSFSSWFWTAFHYILFMNSYAILITHLLYRYWVIRKPYKIALFSNPRFIIEWIVAVAAMGFMLMFLCYAVMEPIDSPLMIETRRAFLRKYNHSRNDGWVIANYWPNDEWDIAAIAVAWTYDAMGIMIVCVVVTLASLTYTHISAAFTLSPRARIAQLQLLRTVCVQTFIPMACVMIPYFVNLTLPMFGIIIPIITDTTGIVMAFFPSWDPLAVILLMKPYRDGLRSMICGEKKKKETLDETNMTSMAVTVTS